jgi:putative oxidoreductase
LIQIATYYEKLKAVSLSTLLLRIPIVIVFIQQGLAKIPVTVEDAEAFDLPYIVWWFVAYGELGAGIGLIVGGLVFWDKILPWLGDAITRFSGFTIGCIMTGVIWIGEPESFMYVILYDNFHVLLWVGGLFFALRGNSK